MKSAPKAQTVRFFDLMFEQYLFEDGYKVPVWTNPNKRTRWASNAEEAAQLVAASPTDQNVYFGLGAMRNPPKSGRGKEADVDVITSLYLDIDINDGKVERGKGDKLPSNKKQAKEIIEKIGLEPSILVFSGHGFQAYWLLKEPLEFETDKERAEAKALTKAWNETARLVAHDLGFAIDKTFDLSRVFRVPGSMNRKSEPHVECVMLEPEDNESPRRYIPDDFEVFIAPEYLGLEGKAHKPHSVVVPVNAVSGRKDVGVPKIIEVMCDNDPKFKQTWDRKRSDFSDTSASSYDLAIANFMVLAKCDDQTIADAIYHWRLKHGEDPAKAQRRDYIMRTLSRARTLYQSEKSVNNLMDLSHESDPKKVKVESEMDEDEKSETEKILELISFTLGIRIRKIIRHGTENELYSLILDNGNDVSIGSMETLFNQDKVRSKIASATTIVIPIFKKVVWHRQVGCMLRATVLVENQDSTRAGTITPLLDRYLNYGENTLFYDDNWNNALKNDDPFVREGILHIHCPTFKKWIKLDQGEPIERAFLHDALRHLGFKTVTINGKIRGNPICRTYWATRVENVKDISIPKQRKSKREEEEAEHPL